jgi:hypothetical protein
MAVAVAQQLFLWQLWQFSLKVLPQLVAQAPKVPQNATLCHMTPHPEQPSVATFSHASGERGVDTICYRAA